MFWALSRRDLAALSRLRVPLGSTSFATPNPIHNYFSCAWSVIALVGTSSGRESRDQAKGTLHRTITVKVP
jgi:hypothetical protein